MSSEGKMDSNDTVGLRDGNSEKNNQPRMPGAWVKDLFQPIYDFDSIVAAGKDGYKTEERKIKRVPILDPETVREVFERVHQRVIESEKRRLEEIQEVKEKEQTKLIDPRKSSIWNTEELETLRKVYKAAKGEISKLEVALYEKTEHNNELEATILKQRKEIESLKERLSEATKANQRLVIHRDSLEKEYAVSGVKLAALTEMWHDIEAEKVKAMEDAKSAHLELDKERLLRQKLDVDMMEAKQNLLRETALVERNVQTKYEMEINDLQDVIKDLTIELKEERKLHEASKRGLEHLRNHFSSLPLQHLMPPNAVEKDEVDHIDHCSL